MKEVMVLLCSGASTRSHLEYWAQAWTPITGRMWSWRRSMRKFRGFQHFSYEERLRGLGLFSLERGRLQEDFIVSFQYLKGTQKHEGDELFTWSDSDRSRGYSFKLKEEEI